MRRSTLAALVAVVLPVILSACGSGTPPGREGQSFASLTEAARDLSASPEEGSFVPLYWRDDQGKLYLHLRELDSPFLYVSWLARGVGSNDLGLDRGQLGQTRVVRFRRSGPRVLMFQDNLGFRADTDVPAERDAVAESFAFSVIGGFDVVADDGERGVLIDATDFFLRDAHGVSERLAQREEGDFTAQPELSAIYLPRTRGFPDNTEVEAVVTLTGKPTGDYLPTVAPDATHVSVHVHHSLVRLPDDGYTPLPFEPRSGFFGPDYAGGFHNYASPIDAPLKQAWLPRHRLEKRDPQAAVSEPVEPIVYYLDRGAPEPVRSALLEGARWWDQAFAAAGYRDAFQVKLLPEGADPMDVRYNVIQWVHRATRGWSYGMSVRDPRTGEIIKGHVTLGSLRVRQDLLLAEGLLLPYGKQDRAAEAQDLALARLRQLSAHEVGHTLGIAHNFAASVNDRASVMDYPHPLIRLDESGAIDLGAAYAEGIGAWDRRAILFGYQDFPEGVDAESARADILRETLSMGLHYVGDADSRSVGSAHPLGSLWDNGANAIDELQRLGVVRRAVLDRLSEAVLQPGRPMAQIEEALVPMYLLHRYQVQAAGKYLGGQYFEYALRGDGQVPVTKVVPGPEQRRALQALLDTVGPAYLALNPALVALIPGRPPGYPATRELFQRSTGSVFDPLAPAEAAVALTLEVLLNAERAARMNRLREVDASLPGFASVLDELLGRSWLRDSVDAEGAALQRTVNEAVLAALMTLAKNPGTTPQVRAQAMDALSRIADFPRPSALDDADWRAHFGAAKRLAEQALKAPLPEDPVPLTPPPGSPIGLPAGSSRG
jgi:hypothetical protein